MSIGMAINAITTRMIKAMTARPTVYLFSLVQKLPDLHSAASY
jgi:hypothetical protein